VKGNAWWLGNLCTRHFLIGRGERNFTAHEVA
jgi:hypothetical protein